MTGDRHGLGQAIPHRQDARLTILAPHIEGIEGKERHTDCNETAGTHPGTRDDILLPKDLMTRTFLQIAI
jgi:hypothetical protein